MPAGFHENQSTEDEIETKPENEEIQAHDKDKEEPSKVEVFEKNKESNDYGEEDFPFNFADELETAPTKKEKV